MFNSKNNLCENKKVKMRKILQAPRNGATQTETEHHNLVKCPQHVSEGLQPVTACPVHTDEGMTLVL